jgi:tRNA threonylcarbamoyladenosine biosynthesis protein TsaB
MLNRLQPVFFFIIMKRACRGRADMTNNRAERLEMGQATNLLVIDTSSDQPVVAIMSRGGGAHVSSSLATGRHGCDLVPRIGDLLREASLSVMDLDVIAVGRGPGSYTGLRIGLTAARTLAYTTGAVLLGFDSLEGWARTAPPEASCIHVVADAQRGDVYAADFLRDSVGDPPKLLTASRIEPLPSWSLRLDRQGCVVGPGLDSPRIRAAVPAELSVSDARPDRSRGLALLELARQLHAAGRRDDLWTLEPNYLRRSAAEETWDARRTRPS